MNFELFRFGTLYFCYFSTQLIIHTLIHLSLCELGYLFGIWVFIIVFEWLEREISN